MPNSVLRRDLVRVVLWMTGAAVVVLRHGGVDPGALGHAAHHGDTRDPQRRRIGDPAGVGAFNPAHMPRALGAGAWRCM